MSIVFLLLILILSSFHGSGTPQAAAAAPVTNPSEARAVNAIFEKWNISARQSRRRWNTSDDICSDVALEGDASVGNLYDDVNFNPGIICDCNSSVCHVTRLKAYELNITGTFPAEMELLSQLNNLQIGRNYLSGPLPAYIGNFTSMQYLSIGFNLFSGEIPKELGRLNALKSLGMGLNNFTGKLPSELGNITGLEQMYIDSIGVTGGIPSSFENFRKLKFMWAGDNNFGGKLPDFIGNLTGLTSVRLQGNSFQGPIPSTIGKLVQLTELRLSNILNESSPFSFIEQLPSLAILILRDSKISGAIPTSIGKKTNLTYLDLSFNHLSGQLPQSLFVIPSLETLYLGNNNFTGSLPLEKSGNLRIIDVSYNHLSGTLPSWTAENNLQLNLVANDFESNLPQGLHCLQNSVPCYRGSPSYYSFAINCGGNELILPDGTIYEADNQNLTTASYYVNDNFRWAVSSVGTYYENSQPHYIQNSLFNILKASNVELFQSARTAPSSLRYYGLALENGNYTVTLNFAETAFPDTQSWMSLGKRIFDIYIQGHLREKDFDIRKEAGGRSLTAVRRNYSALVTDNFIEVHFFWAGKGTCCIPVQGYYGPLISAISVTPNFNPTVPNHLPEKKNNKAFIAGVIVAVTLALFLFLIIGFFIWRSKRKTPKDENEVFDGLPVQPKFYSFAELKIATDNFNPANKLGQGGFGAVFKGHLADGELVAVKRLSETSVQGQRLFVAEAAAISFVQQRNLVKLHGCCYEGKTRLLVYEYMRNNSLEHVLFGSKGFHLDWPTRFNICLGTAKGLTYLHEESNPRIIHRDIKASNILLDDDLNPKISDFGLAKFCNDEVSHLNTRVAGTFGYLAPEYAMRGILTEKVDTYAFGVVVLEVLSGRQNIGSASGDTNEKTSLLEWAWKLHMGNQSYEILDPSLSSFNKKEAIQSIQVAFLCTQTNPAVRPAMSRVVAMLTGVAEIDDTVPNPPYWTDIGDGFDTSTSTSYPLLSSSNATGEFASSTGNSAATPFLRGHLYLNR